MTTPRRAVSGWRHARAIALLPFMNTVVIPSVLVALAPPAMPSGTPFEWALRFVGLALLVAGAALVAHSVRLFVRIGEGTLAPWDPTKTLVNVGAYRFSRNPMKGGLFIVLAGEALALQSLPVAAWLALFALVNIVYIRVSEEPGLRARFGAAYDEYCRSVPRWFPSLGARGASLTENYR